jgi:hypothetical protein
MFEPHNIEHITAKLADDLVEMHNVGAIELEYWETARLLVEKYYDVSTKITIGERFDCPCKGCWTTRNIAPSGYCLNGIGVK